MSSPFSFHCMICFEGFDIEIRYPVVLPCGHTYVCNHCADRLDKCMECRTSLCYVIPRPQPADPLASRYGGRGRQNQTPNKPQPPIKKRLPLPKNVVLMSLIEATEIAAENVRNQPQQPSLTDSPMLSIPSSVLDVEEDEEEKIRAGTSLAISDAGTYAVSAREGLQIYPSCPEVASGSSHTESEEDVDTLVRFFHLENKLDPGQASSPEDNEAPPARLSLGDRVQIVSIDGGWAKLSRGYGFVRADGQKLVKVGGSVDRACKLEAMLRLLSARRNSLRSEQTKVDTQFITLMSELQLSLMTDEDLTVIAADTFQGKHSNQNRLPIVEPSLAEVRDNESSGHLNVQEVRSINSEDATPLKPRPMRRPSTPPPETSRGFLCGSATDVFDTIMPLGGSSEHRQSRALPNVTRTPAVSQLLSEASQRSIASIEEAVTTAAVTATPTRMITSATHTNPSPSALKAGARAWREMHGRAASSGAGIDFRTGMSGHSALTSISTHPHDYLEEPSQRPITTFRGMSNHTALTMWKPFRRQQQAVTSLAMPSYRGHEADDGSTVDSSSILSSRH
mmetsp:Transcript_14671/g.23090  ORF Transcript_14671/g.23090 Transcript_14671/m.23090 type:complete len:565 (+) Transcript_14671:294-1988(+)